MMQELASSQRNCASARHSSPLAQKPTSRAASKPASAREASEGPCAPLDTADVSEVESGSVGPTHALQPKQPLGRSLDSAMCAWRRTRVSAASALESLWGSTLPGQLLPCQKLEERRRNHSVASMDADAVRAALPQTLAASERSAVDVASLRHSLPAPTWRCRAASAAAASDLKWSPKLARGARRRRSRSKGARHAVTTSRRGVGTCKDDGHDTTLLVGHVLESIAGVP